MNSHDIPQCELKDNGLEELVILSVTHHSADTMDRLSDLVISDSDRDRSLSELKELLDAEELVYISTCNRVSFIIVSHRKPEVLLKVLNNWFIARRGSEDVPSLEQWIQLNGREALDHLLLVASSIDSMVVGERQILGQIKQAFKDAHESGLSGPKLQFIFEQTFKIAKQVYRSTSLSKGRLSVVSLVEDRLKEFCLNRSVTRVVLVGVGKMIEKLGEFLSTIPTVELLFVNRTAAHSNVLVERFGGASMSLNDLLVSSFPIDVLATSTAAPHHLFGERFFERANDSEILAIDLAIPPDIDPAVADMKAVTLINMDSLKTVSDKHRASRSASIDAAKKILEDGAEAIVDRWKIRSINPAIGLLTKKYTRESMDQLNKLLETKLGTLDEVEKDELSRWAQRMAKHWAVLHASGVKETARNCCMKAVTSYLAGVGVEG